MSTAWSAGLYALRASVMIETRARVPSGWTICQSSRIAWIGMREETAHKFSVPPRVSRS